jgi:hypothetical protein
MAITRSRRAHWGSSTPPPDTYHSQKNKHPSTPSRCGVLWAKAYSIELGIDIPQKTIHKLTGINERTQRRILSSNQPRTLHNRPDSGPDPRGRNRAITRQETAAISDYLDDPSVPLDDRGKPWLDIAYDSGVSLPKTFHFKPPGYRTIQPQSVQRACKSDEGIINAICEEEKELTDKQAKARNTWTDEQLAEKPHSED